MENYLKGVKPLILKNRTISTSKSNKRFYQMKNNDNMTRFTPMPANLHAISRKNKRKFQNEESIDLHGMTQNEAFVALSNFFQSCIDRNIRKVLVITGGNALRHTVLRVSFQTWVRDYFGNYVVSCAPANIWHGGQGAFYIILKGNK